MTKLLNKIKRYDTFFILSIIAFAILIFSYNNYLTDITEDYNGKIGNATQEYNEKMNALEEEYNDKINQLIKELSDTEEELNSQITVLEDILQITQKENQEKIEKLSDTIEEVEEESNIKLDELKQEVKNINIQSADFTAIVDDVLESVVSIITDEAQGSGAIISSDGFIVTNYHVIEDAESIRVLTYSGQIINAAAIGYEPNSDVAVLKVGGSFQDLDFGDSGDVRVGQKVIALGNPGGLDFTVTEGIVSAKRTSAGTQYLQTDVPINPGNSGGPLVNKEGEIIGINNFKIKDFEGLGFAIASNVVESVVDQIMEEYDELTD